MDISKIKVGSTVYNVKDATARTKLAGIEDGAQAHIAPTSAEVKSALGTGSGTSKFLREDGTWVTPTDKNSASLQVSDTTNRKINTSETTGKYIQFTGGTNKITVTDGTSSFDVAVTPSISNNVTGSSLTADKIILGNGSSAVKTSSKGIVTTLGSDDTTVPTSKAVQTAITNATAGLTGAMHFIGTSSTAVTDGGTETPTIDGYSGTAKTSGNVVLYGAKEFVWTGTAWEELGNEGSYALSTIKVEGTGALGGGGNLTANRTITHNTSGVTAGTYGPSANVTGSEGNTIKVPEITVDTYGHVTGVTERTYTSKNSTYTGYNIAFQSNAGTTVDTYKALTSPSKTLKAGANVEMSAASNVITISATDTTYESKAAASGGTAVSLVTTGEKYAWNAKTSNQGTVTKVTAGAGLNTTSADTATDGGNFTTSGTIYLTKSGVTAGTYRSVTVDKYGRVTAGSNPTDANTTYKLTIGSTTYGDTTNGVSLGSFTVDETEETLEIA